MKINFTKMHGLGNDFVVIDAIHQNIELTPEQLQFLSDRHFGVGCDQILLVESPRLPDADFRYRIFNANGKEVGQCGNGARCFAKFIRDKQFSDKNIIRAETLSGTLVLITNSDETISVNMGIPQFEPNCIPLLAETRKTSYTLEADKQTIHFGAVSVGNPHAVLLVDDIDNARVQTLGPRLMQHPHFPEQANIGFMKIDNQQSIRLRVYERGTGETLACGSGACAAVAVGIDQQRLVTPVSVNLPGGNLTIDWKGEAEPVMMTGTATTVYEGIITL
ncbi:MAG TPA: diaminopimelate epimerase [Crenotrichaceae bacterium]|nr:diaminopimelate epimerase [Crenotrichaceae bacterium]